MDVPPDAAKDGKNAAAGAGAPDVKPASGSSAAAEKPAEVVEDFPDPDEDDLDDLDDMLDDFSSLKQALKPANVTDPTEPDSNKGPAAASQAGNPQPSAALDFQDDDPTDQLQAGISGLLNEIDKSPGLQAGFDDMFKRLAEVDIPGDGDPQSEEMQAKFVEEMFKQMAAVSGPAPPRAGAAAPSGSAPGSSAPSGSAADAAAPKAATTDEDASFQETIQRTMERMQASGDQATAAAASGNADDFMTEMLKQMSSGDFSGEGSEEDFSKLLMGMMEQLTNKEILYEPMKELNDKFPAWMEKNRASTSADDLKRYDEQKAVVAEIVGKFEEKTYSDTNPADREYIVERMQKMQVAGSPPADLVGDMASAQDALAATEDQCNPQ